MPLCDIMELTSLIERAHQTGSARFPAIRYELSAFRAWVLAAGVEPAALEAHAADLFLAAASGAGEPTAVTLFDQLHVRHIRSGPGRMSLRPDQLDELRQTLRVRLLTGQPNGQPPKIQQYKGNGPLGAWVRVTTARIALELRENAGRQAARDLGSDAAINALVASDGNPELMAAKTQHRDLFRQEIGRCFAELDERDKALLRMHYLHEMSIDDMGNILRVHRATVARWLVALRQRIFDQLCERLQLQIPSGTAVRSLIRLVRADIDVSVDRALSDRQG